MENRILSEIRDFLAYLRNVQVKQQERYSRMSGYASVRLEASITAGGIVFYQKREPGTGDGHRRMYLGTGNSQSVRAVQESRYLRESLNTISKDIALLEEFLAQYDSISFHNINSRLPKAYKLRRAVMMNANEAAEEWKRKSEAYKSTFKVVRPEELIHTTIDGTKVRSKSEALIYNLLVEGGYTFVYELPVKGKFRTFYPDFTILSEIDYKTVIRIEHQGKMDDPQYRDHAESREYSYWKNGFLPSRDVYFTYDDCHGGFDIGPILEILKNRVRPTV